MRELVAQLREEPEALDTSPSKLRGPQVFENRSPPTGSAEKPKEKRKRRTLMTSLCADPANAYIPFL